MVENKKIVNNSRKREKFLEIQILRMILCLWIVIHHCSSIYNPLLKKIILSQLHVPTFFIISFYFLYNNLSNRNIKKIKLRFERLLIPYIIWPILIFMINNILFITLKLGRFNKILSINNLIIQIIFGINIHDIFWFQFDLIMITLFYSIITFIFKRNFLFIFIILMIISYILQYCDFYYHYFNQYKQKYMRCMGSIIEIIPFTISGFILSSFEVIPKFKKDKFKIILFNIIILYFLIRNNNPNYFYGLRYHGITLNLGAICLFITFLLIQIDINNGIIKSFIELITNYTGGIYYLHLIMKDYLNKRFMIIRKRTILGSFFIYLSSYFICFIGLKILGNTKLKFLFY